MIKIALALLAFGALLAKDEFIITYNLLSKDGVIVNEEFLLSHAMTKSSSPKILGECEVLIDDDEERSKREILKEKKDEILFCLFTFGVKLESRDIVQDFQSTTTSKLSISPTRVLISFDGDFTKLEIISSHFQKEY